MNQEELLDKIKRLSIWKQGNVRAPHKPLLILYALGQLQSQQTQMLPYSQVKTDLTNLLREFGPQRKSYHPEQPFVRLSNDGIWDITLPFEKNRFTSSLLLKHDIKGGFKRDIINLFNSNQPLIQQVSDFLLHEHFAESLHEDILQAVGLTTVYVKRKQRDPRFREKILQAYEYSCAICGFNVRHGHRLVGVEAAHIKWHQAGGPDVEENGLALCTMHHKLFDQGVFTFSDEKEILVSKLAHGTHGFEDWLMRYHGKKVKSPIDPHYKPNEFYLHWHVKEVFKGPARYIVAN